ncbi:MAG: MBL fold metallo-hydrolase [Catenulisporales bacterium]|nr:MBL fold metallo-hydrolase [Catenulisporales bacterium]
MNDQTGRESRGGDGFRGADQRSGQGPNRSPRTKVLATVAALVFVLASAAVTLVLIRGRTTPWPPPGWLFAACDVGQGDALVLASGPAEAVVVDTGPDPAKADRCLKTLGIRKIPLLVLTHFHADHVDGVPGVMRDRAVTEIETTDDPDPPRGAAEVSAWADTAGVHTSQATAGERRAYGPLSWDVLWPDPAANLNVKPNPPAQRTRKKSKHRHGSEEGSGPNNSSVVLKVPHHGSRFQDQDFFRAVRPRVSIVSVGSENTYGHPARDTLALAGSNGASVFRTDRDGQIVVFGSARRLRVALRR